MTTITGWVLYVPWPCAKLSAWITSLNSHTKPYKVKTLLLSEWIKDPMIDVEPPIKARKTWSDSYQHHHSTFLPERRRVLSWSTWILEPDYPSWRLASATWWVIESWATDFSYSHPLRLALLQERCWCMWAIAKTSSVRTGMASTAQSAASTALNGGLGNTPVCDPTHKGFPCITVRRGGLYSHHPFASMVSLVFPSAGPGTRRALLTPGWRSPFYWWWWEGLREEGSSVYIHLSYM